MLIQYTHLSELSEAERQRLKSLVLGRTLNEGPMQFEGKVLSPAEVANQKRIWESEAQSLSRKMLLG